MEAWGACGSPTTRAWGTQVAVKFMSPEIAQNPNLVTRFSREAHAAANIKSPHVVQILDHGITPDSVPYIVMELLDGESLQKAPQARGPPPGRADRADSSARPARR